MAPAPRATPRPNIIEGRGHYVGTSSPRPHVCKPPIAHIGCCDGTGGSTITEESTRHPTHPMPAEMVGKRTVCIDGVPSGGPYWVCDECGTGWRIGDACNVCDWYAVRGREARPHMGVCSCGSKWHRMTRRELRRAKRRAAKAAR